MTLQNSSRAAAGAFRKLALAATVAGLLGAALPVHAASAVVLYTADGLENLYRDVLPASRRRKASRSTS